jgi:hypothetical protein
MATPGDWMEQVASGTYDCHSAETAREELFSLCESDPELAKILAKHNSNRITLAELERHLVQSGAGQWARGHWVPASAFAFGFTLEYLLDHQSDGDFRRVAWMILRYFQDNKKGPVE